MAEKSTAPEKDEKKVVVPKKASDIIRLKIDKLMKNPAKPVYVPERPEDKLPRVFNPPEFIRNIWGSSAGAGSGDFHVYRGVRRREYARQKIEKTMSEKEEKDHAFQMKLAQHKQEADEATAKKAAKRLKKNQKRRAKRNEMKKTNPRPKQKKIKKAISDFIKKDKPADAQKEEESDEDSDSDEEEMEREVDTKPDSSEEERKETVADAQTAEIEKEGESNKESKKNEEEMDNEKSEDE